MLHSKPSFWSLIAMVLVIGPPWPEAAGATKKQDCPPKLGVMCSGGLVTDPKRLCRLRGGSWSEGLCIPRSKSGSKSYGDSLQQQMKSAGRRLKCPRGVGGLRLSPIWSGQVQTDHKNGWLIAHCAYEGEGSRARPTFARVMWAETANAQPVGCSEQVPNSNRVNSPTHRMAALFGADSPNRRLSAAALGRDLMTQVKSDALPCPRADRETAKAATRRPEPARRSAKRPRALHADCTINHSVFDRSWKKYSDFDDRIPFRSRSHPVQRYHDAYENLLRHKVQAFKLRHEMALNREARKEMRAYRKALINGTKANLLKAFFRLAAFTGMTVRNGVGLGRTYAGLFSSASLVKQVGGALDTVNSLALPGSGYAIDTKDIPGKVKKVGVDTAIEAMKEFDHPERVVAKLVQSTAKAVLPNPALSERELDILRDQHLEKRHLDDALQKSYRLGAGRRDELRKMERAMESDRSEIVRWEREERKRVRFMLTESCRESR